MKDDQWDTFLDKRAKKEALLGNRKLAQIRRAVLIK